MTNQTRHDPIRKHYDWLERTDAISDWIFYFAAALSLLVLIVDRKDHAKIYDVLLLLFVFGVVALFVIGLTNRLYLAPRAEDKRRQDFLSSAYSVNTTHERTKGYYNNSLTIPLERIGAQILENSLFSKTLLRHISIRQRVKICVYAAIWLLCLITRQTDFGIILAVSQTLFSEQILSKWMRVEWLRMRFERTYDDAYRLMQSGRGTPTFDAAAIELFGTYETGKSAGGITIPSKLFHKINGNLSKEWDSIRADLKI